MKKIISFIICFIMLMSFSACGQKDYVGVDKAKQTVVDDIGAAVEDVEFALNDLITDNNGDYYDMRFTKDGKEYRYKVDALTGKIIEKNSTSDNNNNNNSNATTNNADSGIIDDVTDNLLDNNDNNNNNGTNVDTTSSTSM